MNSANAKHAVAVLLANLREIKQANAGGVVANNRVLDQPANNWSTKSQDEINAAITTVSAEQQAVLQAYFDAHATNANSEKGRA